MADATPLTEISRESASAGTMLVAARRTGNVGSSMAAIDRRRSSGRRSSARTQARPSY